MIISQYIQHCFLYFAPLWMIISTFDNVIVENFEKIEEVKNSFVAEIISEKVTMVQTCKLKDQ